MVIVCRKISEFQILQFPQMMLGPLSKRVRSLRQQFTKPQLNSVDTFHHQNWILPNVRILLVAKLTDWIAAIVNITADGSR